MANFDGTDAFIDSREVIARIEELESEISDLDIDSDYDEIIDLRDELSVLIELQDDCNYGDWHYGETLIHEDHFTDYARDLVTDCGYVPSDLPEWIVIDWDETANNLKPDYNEVEFQGSTYLIHY